jgi:hypothetical protein
MLNNEQKPPLRQTDVVCSTGIGNEYLNFLENKKHSLGNFGFDANFIPDIAFDFQKSIIEKSILKGRIAVFADTGLGKTLIQLSIAKNIINHTNKKVLIFSNTLYSLLPKPTLLKSSIGNSVSYSNIKNQF